MLRLTPNYCCQKWDHIRAAIILLFPYCYRHLESRTHLRSLQRQQKHRPLLLARRRPLGLPSRQQPLLLLLCLLLPLPIPGLLLLCLLLLPGVPLLLPQAPGYEALEHVTQQRAEVEVGFDEREPGGWRDAPAAQRSTAGLQTSIGGAALPYGG